MASSTHHVDQREKLTPLIKKQTMSLEHFATVNQWCINEGWNIGLEDGPLYYHVDPDGHYLYYYQDEPMGSMSLIQHTPLFFTIGPYIIAKEYRGKGFGVIIWNSTMSRLETSNQPTILLYAVETQIRFYRYNQFKTKHRNLRWTINSSGCANQPNFEPCLPINKNLINRIIAYDKTIFAVARERIINELINYPNIKGVFSSDGIRIKGYGFIRPCINGFRIGPLYADDSTIAKHLICSLIVYAQNQSVIMDVPDMNIKGQVLLQELGGVRDEPYDTIAMVRGVLPTHYIDNIGKNFGIFSLEIG